MKGHTNPPSELRIDRLQTYLSTHLDRPGAGAMTHLDHDVPFALADDGQARPGERPDLVRPADDEAPDVATRAARTLTVPQRRDGTASARFTTLQRPNDDPPQPSTPPTEGRAA